MKNKRYRELAAILVMMTMTVGSITTVAAETETTAETTAAMPAQDADGYSADRKETEESTEPEEEQKQKNSRWEKEPENVEMKLWAVGKDQAETGSLKDLLDGSDEELEEWKD